jgi:citrate synthase
VNDGLSPIERAFQLARTGHYSTLDGIKTRMLYEGYVIDQLSAKAFAAALHHLIEVAPGKVADNDNAP